LIGVNYLLDGFTITHGLGLFRGARELIKKTEFHAEHSWRKPHASASASRNRAAWQCDCYRIASAPANHSSKWEV